MPRKPKAPPLPDDELPDFLRPQNAGGTDQLVDRISSPAVPVAPEDLAVAGAADGAEAEQVVEDPTLGDLAASSPRQPDALDDLPSLTHILPTDDPDIDELPTYAPGQPAINRALVEGMGFGVPVPPKAADAASGGSARMGAIHDFTVGADLERHLAAAATPSDAGGAAAAASGLLNAAAPEELPAPYPAGAVGEGGPLPEIAARERLGSVVQDRLQGVADARAVVVKYVARIEILQAWQFNANLHNAPEWVDRNWLAYDEGPALNVTKPNGDHVGMAKVGDWVVRQNTTVDDASHPSGVRVLPDHIAVVTEREFARLYRPERAAA